MNRRPVAPGVVVPDDLAGPQNQIVERNNPTTLFARADFLLNAKNTLNLNLNRLNASDAGNQNSTRTDTAVLGGQFNHSGKASVCWSISKEPALQRVQECIRESSNQEGLVTTTSVGFIARWVARAWSILNILIIFLFAIGESLRPLGPVPTYQEWISLALWPVGVAIGLLLSWLREILGGIVTMGCLATFYIWTLFRSGTLPRGPFFLLIAAPSLVFILAGVLSLRRTTHGA
jgi:hypothetical protein